MSAPNIELCSSCGRDVDNDCACASDDPCPDDWDTDDD